jgi:hypothetical protein
VPAFKPRNRLKVDRSRALIFRNTLLKPFLYDRSNASAGQPAYTPKQNSDLLVRT